VLALWPELAAAKRAVLSTPESFGVRVGPDDLRYTLESTGQYHMPCCLSWRGHPAIINPSDTAAARRKTDKLDAKKLAHPSLTGLWRESWMATDVVQELRVLTIQRARLVSERSRLTNRINGALLRYGHTVGQLGPLNGNLVRPLIEDFCTEGRVSLYPEFFSDHKLPPCVVHVIPPMGRRVDQLTTEIAAVERLTLEGIDQADWIAQGGPVVKGDVLRRDLQSVPGVGAWTAAVWLAEIGDITRFAHVKQACAYAGLDASLGVSAGKVTNRCARKGNQRLWGALKDAARGALARTSQSNFINWVRASMGRQVKGSKARAMNALARRIARALDCVPLKCEPFDETRYRPVLSESSYPICGVEEMGLPPRVVSILKANALLTSRQVVEAFFTDLSRRPGCGPRTIQTVASWIHQHQRGPGSPSPTPSGASSEDCVCGG
jgi:transposase